MSCANCVSKPTFWFRFLGWPTQRWRRLHSARKSKISFRAVWAVLVLRAPTGQSGRITVIHYRAGSTSVEKRKLIPTAVLASTWIYVYTILPIESTTTGFKSSHTDHLLRLIDDSPNCGRLQEKDKFRSSINLHPFPTFGHQDLGRCWTDQNLW